LARGGDGHCRLCLPSGAHGFVPRRWRRPKPFPCLDNPDPLNTMTSRTRLEMTLEITPGNKDGK